MGYYGYAGYGYGHHGLGYAGYHGLGYAGYAGYHGLGYAGYAGYHGLGYAYGAHHFAGTCHNAYGASVPCARKKREAEAEAEPALLYGGFAGYPYAYGAHVVAGEALDHGVAHTAFGAIHSSHVGHCVNYLGEKVAC